MLNILFASLIAQTQLVDVYQRVASDGARIKEIRMEQKEEREAVRAELRDEKKQDIADNVLDRFSLINEKWTSHWDITLTRLSEIVSKLEEAYGETELTNAAELAISEAQVAVETQAEKEYVVEVTDEPVGQTIRSLVQEFKADMKEVRASVQDAKSATREAFTDIKSQQTDENEEE